MLVEKNKKEIKIEKAVIPVAGKAKRWGEITEYIPKELIPIIRSKEVNIKPSIQYVVEELIDSGIKEIIFIVNYEKKALIEWIDNPPISIRHKISEKNYPIVFKKVEQKEPKGLGHAIGCAKNEIGDEFFVVALPDDIIIHSSTPLKRMVDVCNKYGSSVILSQTVPREELPSYGVLFSNTVEKNIDKIDLMIEKPNISQIEDLQKNNDYNMSVIVGRYVLKSPEIFEHISKTKKGTKNEIQLTDAIVNLKEEGHDIYTISDEGFRIDTGEPHKYLKATHFFHSADS